MADKTNTTTEEKIEGRFVVEFPLITEKYQEDYLEKCFRFGQMIYNQCVTKSRKNYNKMTHSPEYRGIKGELNQIYEKRREEKKTAEENGTAVEETEGKTRTRKTPRE